MSATSSTRSDLTRRSFLKAAAATGIAASFAGGALTACSSGEEGGSGAGAEPAADQIYSGICRNFCTNGCFLNCHVRDGKLVRVTARDMPNPEYNRICPKGLTIPHIVYGADRIQYPMKRTGERGSGEFERITWEEAIQTITDTWKQIQAESGPSAIAYHRMTGNNAFLCGSSYGGVLLRFVKAMGMSTLDGAFDTAEPFASDRMVGCGPFTSNNIHLDYKNAKTMIIWGANPAVCQLQTMHFLLEVRDAGTKVIYIDPIYNQTSMLADQWVPLRAGSDGALALGIMRVIVENGWQDEEYLKKNSTAAYLVKEDHTYLRLSDLGQAEAGSEDDRIMVWEGGKAVAFDAATDPELLVKGQDVEGFAVNSAYALLVDRLNERSIEEIVELTNVDAETIKGLAEQIATQTPTSFYTAYGADHYYNGHWNYSCIIATAILTGNVGKPGAFVGTSFIRTGGAPGTPYINVEAALDVESPGDGPTVKMPRMTEVMNEKTHNGQPLEIRSVYLTTSNLLVSNGKRQATLEWFKKLDFIVAADITMTETCNWADIVLPAAHWFECEDAMSKASSHPYILYQEKALEPAFESKPDFEIYKLLAEGMGLAGFDYTEQEYLEKILDSDAARELGITYEALREKKAIEWLASDYVYAGDGVYKTPTGKAQFYIENPTGSNPYKDGWVLEKEYLPYWEPPREAWPEAELRKTYPLHLITEKSKYRTHTIWGQVELMRELDPEPYVNINPADAETYGIADGDTVRLFNDRGYVVLKAHLFNNIPVGMILMQKGWQKHQFIDGHYSDLTSDVMNGMCANQPFFDVVVGIEKA